LFDIRKLSCSLAENEEELIDNIRDFSEAQFVARCDEFFNKIGFCESGNASQTVADLIIQRING
jgi:hypothetical protein